MVYTMDLQFALGSLNYCQFPRLPQPICFDMASLRGPRSVFSSFMNSLATSPLETEYHLHGWSCFFADSASPEGAYASKQNPTLLSPGPGWTRSPLVFTNSGSFPTSSLQNTPYLSLVTHPFKTEGARQGVKLLFLARIGLPWSLKFDFNDLGHEIPQKS